MTVLPLLDSLSDDELVAETQRLAANARAATAALLRALMELDARRLYLREGCASLFVYCTQVLHLAEGAAYNRIEGARAARRHPSVLEGLADGSLTLTSIRLLAPHLTEDNHQELLEEARHKSKREIEVLIATLRPRPPVPTVIRKLPDRPGSAPQSRAALAGNSAPLSALGKTTGQLVPERAATARCAGAASDTTKSRVGVLAPPPAPAIDPLSADRYKLQVTISHETHAKLRRVQDLLRHTHPSGDVAAVLDRALTLLLADLERRRYGATPTPRETVRTPPTPGAFPRRSGGRCGSAIRDAARSLAPWVAAEKPDFSSSTTCGPSPTEARPPLRTSSCDAEHTTCTRRRYSLATGPTRCARRPDHRGPAGPDATRVPFGRHQLL